MKDFKTAWKTLANNKNNTLANHLQYAVLKAMSAKSNDKLEIIHSILTAHLSRISNKNKLANGRSQYDCLRNDYNPHWFARKSDVIFGELEMNFFESEEECNLYHKLMDSFSMQSLQKYWDNGFNLKTSEELESVAA